MRDRRWPASAYPRRSTSPPAGSRAARPPAPRSARPRHRRGARLVALEHPQLACSCADRRDPHRTPGPVGCGQTGRDDRALPCTMRRALLAGRSRAIGPEPVAASDSGGPIPARVVGAGDAAARPCDGLRSCAGCSHPGGNAHWNRADWCPVNCPMICWNSAGPSFSGRVGWGAGDSMSTVGSWLAVPPRERVQYVSSVIQSASAVYIHSPRGSDDHRRLSRGRNR